MGIAIEELLGYSVNVDRTNEQQQENNDPVTSYSRINSFLSCRYCIGYEAMPLMSSGRGRTLLVSASSQ